MSDPESDLDPEQDTLVTLTMLLATLIVVLSLVTLILVSTGYLTTGIATGVGIGITPGVADMSIDLAVFLPLVAALLPWFALFNYRIWRQLRGKAPLPIRAVAPLVMMAAIVFPIMLNAYARETLYVSRAQRWGWVLTIGLELLAILFAQYAGEHMVADHRRLSAPCPDDGGEE